MSFKTIIIEIDCIFGRILLEVDSMTLDDLQFLIRARQFDVDQTGSGQLVSGRD